MTSAVLLFAAQGSGPDTAAADLLVYIRNHGDAETKQLVNEFLRRCFETFHSDAGNLKDDEKHVLESSVLEKLDKPETLVTNPPSCQFNAVVESVTFYMHQMLDLFLYLRQNTLSSPTGEVIKTAGVCSGMIPAVLAASFPSSSWTRLVEYAVDAFRITFWVAIRSSLVCYKHTSGKKSGKPWALAVKGCPLDQLQNKVDDHNERILVRVCPLGYWSRRGRFIYLTTSSARKAPYSSLSNFR